MSFQVKLLVMMAALGSSGCFHLSDRKIADEEMVLTPDTVEVLAGDYRVMLDKNSRSEHWFPIPYDLIYDLEANGLHPGMSPSTLSVRFTKEKVWLTLKCQGKGDSHVLAYHLIDNELRLDQPMSAPSGGGGIEMLILFGGYTKAAGFGRRKDGKLWMRCHSTIFVTTLLFVPLFFWNDETTSYFDPVKLPDEPEVND